MSELDRAGLGFRLRVLAAFAAVYFIWGSTYLGIRFAIETLPPFLMAGIRIVVAGVALYAWARLRGAPRPEMFYWKGALVVGGLMLFVGNGGVVWAEQVVPSGLAALLVATMPLWMVVLNWARGGVRPSVGLAGRILLGFAGVALLLGPGDLAGGSGVDPMGAAALLLASASWALGSLISRGSSLPGSALMATAMEMLAGGFLLLVAGSLTGEWVRLALDQISLRSALSVGYLIIFGSIVGFTAYIWLLRAVSPALVSTYAYVNPLVAVSLGWALAGESLNARTLLAAAVIVASVVLITTYRVHPSAPAEDGSLAGTASGARGA